MMNHPFRYKQIIDSFIHTKMKRNSRKNYHIFSIYVDHDNHYQHAHEKVREKSISIHNEDGNYNKKN